MLFNSYVFIFLFLPICWLLYFGCNKKHWYKMGLVVLTIMSFLFYAYNNVSYLILLVFSIVFNWCISRGIVRYKREILAKIILVVGVCVNIAIIFYFKYFNFVLENVDLILRTNFRIEQVLLPLGISFYTFQQISYLVDSYKGETSEYSFVEYAAFVSFFPQLVAGPIVLHDEIICQLKDTSKKEISYKSIAEGMYKFAIGLLKKVIVADTFGIAVDWGFNNVNMLSSGEIMLVMLFYTMQIYFDFSGYSDMAIGIASFFNITLPVNFNSPYKACSIVEFWDRWHLTLTRFLRKYVYFPLGGSKKGVLRTYINVFTVFLISGVWHGANWTFIVWGIIHGVANILNRLYKQKWERLHRGIQWIGTFIFINVTWLIFRADSLEQAGILLERLVCMDSFEISKEMMECFRLQEFIILERVFYPMAMVYYKLPGVYMFAFVIVSISLVLVVKNIHEIPFKVSKVKAIQTIISYLWVIVSFSGITTFLYFNF